MTNTNVNAGKRVKNDCVSDPNKTCSYHELETFKPFGANFHILPGKCSLKPILDSSICFCGRDSCIGLESHYFARRCVTSVNSWEGVRWWCSVVEAATSFDLRWLCRLGQLWIRRSQIRRTFSFVLDVCCTTGLLLTFFFNFWQDVCKL